MRLEGVLPIDELDVNLVSSTTLSHVESFRLYFVLVFLREGMFRLVFAYYRLVFDPFKLVFFVLVGPSICHQSICSNLLGWLRLVTHENLIRASC